MVPERDIDVDRLAREVVNAWGTATQAGRGKHLSTDFKALFDKTCAYRMAPAAFFWFLIAMMNGVRYIDTKNSKSAHVKIFAEMSFIRLPLQFRDNS